MVTLIVPLLPSLNVVTHVFWEEVIIEVFLSSLDDQSYTLRGFCLHFRRRVQLQLLGLLQQQIIGRILDCAHLDGEGKDQSRQYNR